VLSLVLTLSIAGDAWAQQLCVQLKWFHQSQFAGFYIAKEDGLYKKAGLDVSFIEGGPKINWQDQMKDTTCPIGVTNSYEVVIARSNSIPVKAVAAVAQVSPIVWFSLKDSGIKSPRQFAGKKVAMVPTGKIHLRGMMKKIGMSMSEMQPMPFSIDMTPLYNGEVDVWSGYHTNLVTKAESEGYEMNIIHPINYGVQIYDDVIYMNEDFIRDNPDTAYKFLQATLQGWMQAVRDPEQAVSATLKYTKNSSPEHQRNLFLHSIPYIHTGEVPIGWMDHAIWDEICTLTHDVGLIKECVKGINVMDDSLLNKIYDKSEEH
jgi:NitT/TauT family transport system substrate-binding protein